MSQSFQVPLTLTVSGDGSISKSHNISQLTDAFASGLTISSNNTSSSVIFKHPSKNVSLLINDFASKTRDALTYFGCLMTGFITRNININTLSLRDVMSFIEAKEKMHMRWMVLKYNLSSKQYY